MNPTIQNSNELNYQEYNLLIVDDHPTNIGVIVDYLESYGFQIMIARSGEKALRRVNHTRPDLILLDVMMPGIDGFETCRRLKADETSKDIPVIFMTALTSTDDKVKGFAAGGIDYVTKPLHQDEVLARITTHLRIKDLTQSLQQSNKELVELNATKDRLFSIVAHDLRGPFLPLLGNAQLMTMMIDPESQTELKTMADTVHRSAKRLHNLLETLLQWSQMERGQMEYQPDSIDLHRVVGKIVQLFTENATDKNITLQSTITKDVFVYTDKNMLEMVIRNLTSNALKFTPQGGQIIISVAPDSTDAEIAEISVADTGVGISPENLDKLLKLNTHHSTKGTSNESGTGLGLMLCREMVEKNGGRIWIESELGQGTVVKFTVRRM